ncbi:ATP-binding cassette domain-containing protein [Streptomyces sp. NPDC001508]|uniref:ABC transporter permease subunit n=1 Tax=Streptomyces sp. NPDC001508 TaxID=3154656 RepID=UPI00331DFB2F
MTPPLTDDDHGRPDAETSPVPDDGGPDGSGEGPRAGRGRWALPTAIVAVAVLLAFAALRLVGWQAPTPVLALGVLLGVLYGVLAVGLILIFRTSRVINLAIGAFGTFATSVYYLLAVYAQLPFVVAFPVALVAGAAVGAGTDMMIVRRFAHAPRILVMVLTLGVAVLLNSLAAPLVQLGQASANRSGTANATLPSGEPSFLPALTIGDLRVPPRQVLLVIITPLLLGWLVWALLRTRAGLAVRAVAGNSELVQLAGIRARAVTTAVWALSAAVAATAAVLGPVQLSTGADTSANPYTLVLRALVAAVFARMRSLPLAFGIGISIGVAEQVLLWNDVRLVWLDGAILVVLLLDALLTRRALGRSADSGESGGWTLVAVDTGWPAPYRSMRSVRALRMIVGGGLVVLAATLPMFTSQLTVQTLTSGCGFALACLSVYVLAGLSGQLSLGQFAVAGVAAVTSVVVLARTGAFLISLPAGIAAGAATAALTGVLGVRRPGTALAALTLTAAGLVPTVLLAPAWGFGTGRTPGLPLIAGKAPGPTAVYLACLAVLLVSVFAVHRLRHGRRGRAMLAVRDNPTLARAFGVRIARTRMLGFVLAGTLAALGGILLAHSSTVVTSDQFAQDLSVKVVLAVVVGGIASLTGALIGSLWLFTVPQLVPGAGLATSATSVGGLLVLMYFPAGIGPALTSGRNYLLRLLTSVRERRAAGAADESEPRADHGKPTGAAARTARPQPDGHGAGTGQLSLSGGTGRRVGPQSERRESGEPLLEVCGVGKQFGGLAAVSSLSLSVRPGEITALIGPNGAGKTTVFDLISGFEPVTTGTVRYAGEDITRLPPDERARRGLIRSFQEPLLFPTMTVSDVLSVAAEARLSRRRDRQAAVEAGLDYYGLGRYRDHRTRELSVGTRRIVELAAMHTLSPKLLLLDEPSSGIAQRETEAMAGVLQRMRADLGLTIVLIEHDLPLAFGIADRVAVLVQGQLLTHGTPDQVQADPAVVDAYLGTRFEQSATSSDRAPA